MAWRFLCLLLFYGSIKTVASSQPRTDLSGIAFIIDPGHSQNENVGIYGYSEAYKVLDVALHLREFLRLSNADTVHVTRSDRQLSISVSQRAVIAQNLAHPNKWFHSIHSDASSMGSPTNSILMLIPDNCATTSGKICQSIYGNTTISMGNWMSDLMSRVYRIGTRGVYGDRTFGTQFGTNYGQSGLGVFKSNVPSTLSEGGFHTNPRQNLLNMNFESKRTEARAIWMSILEHYRVPRPPVRTLAGVISDLESGAPVNGATVSTGSRIYRTNTYEDTFRPYASGDTTLGNGFYYFEALPAGLQSVTATHPAYGDTTFQVSVIDSFFTFQDVKLVSKLPPRVLTSYPPQNATGILPNATLQLSFSRPVHRASAESNIFLLDPSGLKVTATFSWSTGDRSLLFKPLSILIMDTTYRFVVGGQVRDLYNHSFDGNGDGVAGDSLVITFRTRSADVTPPEIFRAFPAAGAIVGAPNHIINITFDEPLDSATVNATNVAIREIGGPVLQKTLQYSQANGRGAINLYLPLGFTPGKSYQIRISGVADQNGNPIPTTSPLVWEFSIAPTTFQYTVVDDFNSGVGNWFQSGQSGSTAGLDSATFSHASSFFLPTLSSNTGSALLRFYWRTQSTDWLLREYLSGGPPRSVLWRKEKTRLQVYVFGDGSGTQFRFAIDDSVDVFPNGTTANHEVSQWSTIDWVGWRLVEWDLENDPVGSWLGNGILEGSLRFDSFQLKYQPESSAGFGQLHFDQLALAKATATSIERRAGENPTTIALYQNYPNPFNPETRIEYDLSRSDVVSLTVVDLLGRQVRTLVFATQEPGRYMMVWDARDDAGQNLPSGMYLYRLRTGSSVLIKKMTLLK